ncbi:TetR/AcrR family transcriptional regulator [Labedella endophytica]|uniref:TetR/AcrR family transcriptional regulator n=1 Tax=Labedella endophytica TaxID=1523160 RepID=A0A433JSW0_9MICO|nr:TetR/AcrR family transcriptional regulator [Labedella endophytica]RUR00949.1 TetR/AcrR family transcriptional regulator [Labedella endophytica]
MTIEDPRLVRTRDALIGAATAALDDGDSESLSITDLVSAAGVSRPSFYQHFGDLPTLVHAAALTRMRSAFETIATPDNIGDSWEEFSDRTLRELIGHFDDHAAFYLRAVKGPGGQQFAASVIRFLSERLRTVSPLAAAITAAERPVERADFLAAGVLWTVTSWLGVETSERVGVDETARRVATLLLSSSGQTPAQIDDLLSSAARSAATGTRTTRTTGLDDAADIPSHDSDSVSKATA